MNDAWISDLGWTLIHFIWQGAVIASLYWIARIFATKPQTRYLIACAALSLLVAIPITTFINAGTPAGSPSIAQISQPVRSEWSTTPAAPIAPSISLPIAAMPWIVIVWCTGAGLLSLRLIFESIFAGRLKSATVWPVPQEWNLRLHQLAERIGVSPYISFRMSTRTPVPCVIGWLRPVILLPVGMLAGLPADQVEAVLAHEIAHIRRHDYLVNLLQRLAEAILFYHPAVWWISREIRREREHCCDDIAVSLTGDPILYAEALADLETSRTSSRHTALAATNGSLPARLSRLLGISPPRANSAELPAIGVAAALILMIGAVVLAQQAGPKPSFEAASITLSPPEFAGFQSHAQGGRYTALTASVRDLIAWAYGVLNFQIAGGPGWASTTHYNISAKMDVATSPVQLRQMLQTLLADRFGLRFHHVTRNHSGYALTIDKNGPKLSESKIPGPGLGFGRGRLNGRGANMRLLASQLSSQMEVPIADRTNLTALYDFTLTWSPDPEADAGLGPSVSTALREQLGLRLDPVRNVPVEYFVIDAVHQPSAN
jgi:uncharacterized protein (TIGR03435 family)